MALPPELQTRVCLVDGDNPGPLVVVTKTLDLLRKHLKDDPVRVVGVCGPMRTGKSYLASLLAGDKQAFPLGNETEACTKGIGIRVVGPETGKPFTWTIVMDTEGAFDPKQDAKRDERLFILSALLSSFLCINITGVLDSQGINMLGHISAIASLVTTPSGDEYASDFAVHAPHLAMVLRDFHLETAHKADGERMTPSEYLEDMLRATRTRNAREAESNYIRDAIKGYFQRRSCFLIPPPTADSDLLHSIDSQPDDALNPGFVAAANAAVKTILDTAQVKTLNGINVSGSTFATMVETYVNAETPSIPSAYDAFCQQVNSSALAAAKEQYKKTYVNELAALLGTSAPSTTFAPVVLPLPDIERAHNQALQAAKNVFADKSVDCATIEEDNENLIRFTVGEFARSQDDNYKASMALCTTFLETQFEAMKRKHQSDESPYQPPHGTIRTFRRDFQAAIDACMALQPTPGPAVDEATVAFRQRHADFDAMLLQSNVQLEAAEREKLRLQHEANVEREKRELNERLASDIERQLRDDKQAHETLLQRERQLADQRLEHMRHEHQQLMEQKEREAAEAAKAKNEMLVGLLRDEVAALKQQAEDTARQRQEELQARAEDQRQRDERFAEMMQDIRHNIKEDQERMQQEAEARAERQVAQREKRLLDKELRKQRQQEKEDKEALQDEKRRLEQQLEEERRQKKAVASKLVEEQYLQDEIRRREQQQEQERRREQQQERRREQQQEQERRREQQLEQERRQKEAVASKHQPPAVRATSPKTSSTQVSQSKGVSVVEEIGLYGAAVAETVVAMEIGAEIGAAIGAFAGPVGAGVGAVAGGCAGAVASAGCYAKKCLDRWLS